MFLSARHCLLLFWVCLKPPCGLIACVLYSGQEHFPEALQLVKEQKLYSEALRLYAADKAQYKVQTQIQLLLINTDHQPPNSSPEVTDVHLLIKLDFDLRYFTLWPLGSELRLCWAPGGAATGRAGWAVAMAMWRASQRPAGVCQQLQLEKRHLCRSANATAARPVSSAGQRPGR